MSHDKVKLALVQEILEKLELAHEGLQLLNNDNSVRSRRLSIAVTELETSVLWLREAVNELQAREVDE